MKFICFNILVVMKFILSALFIFFVLLIVEHDTGSFVSNKTSNEQTITPK